jgi:mannose-6-phosphate isomerase-like protein (cupin superfamily)
VTADPFFVAEQLPHDELRPGTHRRTLKLGEVELLFTSYTRPTVSSPHQHDHASIIYIDEGDFEVTVGDQTHRLGPGAAAVVPPGIVHGLSTPRAGARIIEVWYPVKD